MQRSPDDLRAAVLRFRRAQGERYLAQLAGDASRDPAREANFAAPCHPEISEAYVQLAGEMEAGEHAALGAHMLRAHAERAYAPGRRAAAELAARPGAHGSQRRPLVAWWADLAVLTREAGRNALRATTLNALASAPNALNRPWRTVQVATSEAFGLLQPGRHADAGPEQGNAALARQWLADSADLSAEANRQAARLAGVDLRHEVDLVAALAAVRLSSHVRRETRGHRAGDAWEAFGWRPLLNRRARITRPHHGFVPAAHVVVGGNAETLQIAPSAVELGVVSELSLLEATGRALGILLVSSALPFELRQPAVATVARACGGLAVAGMTHPEPWRRRHGANRRDARSLAQIAAAHLLCRTRLSAAAVLARGEGTEAQQQLARQALDVDVAPEVASVLLGGLSPGGSMRALCHVPDLAAALRGQFDEDWQRNPRAAEPLMGALQRGGVTAWRSWPGTWECRLARACRCSGSYSRRMYATRRKALLEAIGAGVVVIPSAPVAIRNNDVEHDYRQSSDLYYLTGFDEPDSVLVLSTVHSEHRSVLFMPERDVERETWDGPRLGTERALGALGIDAAFPIAELDERLPDYLQGAQRVHYAIGRDAAFDGRFHRAMGVARQRARGGSRYPTEIVDPAVTLHEHRLRKEPCELSLMREAARITRVGHLAAMEAAMPGRYEYEVEAELLRAFRAGGSERPAYGSIVGSGPNATVLHYRKNNRQLQEDDLLLIDAGAEYEYYACDVTRTFPVSGRFTAAQRALYDIVLASQLAAIEASQPGGTLDEVHAVAVDVLVDGLLEQGIFTGTRESVLEQGSHRAYYMHRTSHWLGMDVHDVGSYHQEGSARPLEPGFVLTVEPGLYIREDAEEVDPRFRGIGIRIEDDVLVTPDGPRVLTEDIPKKASDLEHLLLARSRATSGGSAATGS